MEGVEKVEGVLEVVLVEDALEGGVVDKVLNGVGEIGLVVEEVDKDVEVGGLFVGKRVLGEVG
ncbi:hypothetical protein, partial [Neisseria sicca]|uniref:hypothetical protein n=1 Tax=Neisseria sicca TaxID=490 RepID=UPI00164A0339